jgi:hypothetical protein
VHRVFVLVTTNWPDLDKRMNASNEHLLKLSERLKKRRYHTGSG